MTRHAVTAIAARTMNQAGGIFPGSRGIVAQVVLLPWLIF